MKLLMKKPALAAATVSDAPMAKAEVIVVLVLLLAFSVQAVFQAVHISPAYDEPITIATGYYQLKTGDFTLNPTHPPLNFHLAALPLLLMSPQPQFPINNPDCVAKRHWECTNAFTLANAKSFRQMVFLSRLPHIMLGVLLGLVVYIWSRKLYGRIAGLFSLLLFAFSPVFISFSGTALQNITVAFFIVLASFLFWLFLKKPSFKRLFFVSVCLGLALASEYTAFILAVAFVLYFAVQFFLRRQTVYERLMQRPVQNFIPRPFFQRLPCLFAIAFTIGFGIFIVLLVSYHGQFTTLAKSVPSGYSGYALEKISQKFGTGGAASALANFAVERLRLPFASFWSGLAWEFLQTTGESKANFFAGNIYYGSNFFYFFANTFFKTPLPLLLLFATGLFTLWKCRSRAMALNEWILLLIPVLFMLFFLHSSRNAGPSHLLPAYAFMLIIAGRSALLVGKPGGIAPFKITVSALIAWYVLGALLAAPHYFGYFNEFLPQDRAYHVFSDQSNDLGQELRHLSQYMRQNNISRVNLSYFGSINPALEGVSYDYLPSPGFEAWVPNSTVGGTPVAEQCGQVVGIVAISVTNLNGVHLVNHSCYAWLKAHKPIAEIGSSMLVYDIN